MSKHRTALIFGGSGQDGFYLGRLCRERDMRVVSVSRSTGAQPGDVGDPEYVDELVRTVRPDILFHLAARSSTAYEALRDNHRAISGGTWNICEAAARHCPDARVFITGSGLQFENDGSPIDEHRAFAATSPYAVERIHSVYAARYFRTRGLQTYVGYLFHHDSPLRNPQHVSMKIALAARAIAAGRREPLELGDLYVEKEWGFAGDIAAGLLTLVDQDEVTEAVIGTGTTHSVSDWLTLCFDHVDIDWRDHVRPAEGFEPSFRRLVSRPVTIRGLGWRPRVEARELCAMMMESVLASAAGEGAAAAHRPRTARV